MPPQQSYTTNNGIPGAWLDEPYREDSTRPSTIASKAQALTEQALAELQHAVDEERFHRQALREQQCAAEAKKLAAATAKSNKKTAESSKPSKTVPTQTHVAGVVTRPTFVDALPNLNEHNTGRGQNAEGFLALMANSRFGGPTGRTPGRGHISATGRLFDAGIASEDSIAAARLRADARVARGDVGRDERLAAARARLAKGRVVATVSQYAFDTGVKISKAVAPGLGPGPVALGPSQITATPSTPRYQTTPKKGGFPATAGTVQTREGVTGVVRQPVRTNGPMAPSVTTRWTFETPTKPATVGTATTTPSQSVKDQAHGVAYRYVNANKVSAKPATATQKLDKVTTRTDINAEKKSSAPAQLKSSAANVPTGPIGLGLTLNIAKTPELDDGFDVVDGKGPSAANGRTFPHLIMDQLDQEFSPTLNGLQGWDDDHETDDGEEWDMGGLAEWKWVGEKSAKKSKAAKRQA
jgi:hypothetical protein